ncbi:HpcH/HpaI aldolase/citrate lyase family protein [Hephaestia sp. GCM10023244]|uniref:HpcH/HpaI aldolase/citrate lyase family protein n=1 Tax=unclassified Hephaestia TaxID=2631281 RepID=UPI0020772786|nr:CoA ester lyase [Hephaestia sp. MAHUQ-44]MCM8731718.1 CoA ester lyase [Hephaestia sp. MAHUQ-44]
MTESIRPRRSALYLPASNPRAIAKARGLPCDVVILDLEDAVAPEAKPAARAAALVAAREGFGGRELVVRINALDTPWGADDLAAVAEAGPEVRIDAVLAPKITRVDDVARYDEALARAPAAMALWTMIETCRVFSELQAIADMAATTRLSGFVIGSNDLAIEMRARPGADRVTLLPFLTATVAAARASGIAVLDAVCNDFRDLDRVAAECAQGRALGFDGKSLIHPAQIEAANAAFGPDADELADARAVVAAFALAENAGKGVIRLDGRMVERLHLREAERVLALDAAIAERG